ncbi:MAG: alpha/beta hydrolase [Oscillospiraceae bacterium]|nr:alpha/beta hydrolase [Oscillospiraceae bacterium]
MKFYRFGKETSPVMLLLPGTCCHWSVFKGIIPLLTDAFQVVAVSYDGFDETQPNAEFKNMYEKCKRIEHYIKEKFDGKIFAAYGCSLGGSFVGLLIQRKNIHIDHGFIGSSDLDQAGVIGAKIQSGIVCPIMEKSAKSGKLPDWMANMQRKQAAKDGKDPEEVEKSIEFFGNYLKSAQCATKDSIKNQFYSDLITPLEDNIRVENTTVHIFYALKMGDKYFERYEKHFPDADIMARDLGHEELLMKYPEQWAQDIKRCCGLPYDNEKALPEPMSYRREKKRFFETHSYKTADVNGATFNYLDGGKGDKVLVFLVGGLGDPELAFPYIKAFEDEYRMIAIDYPYAYTDAVQLTEGIIGLLDVLGIDKAVWIGASFGGYMAQELAVKHPERTAGICLLSTAAISENVLGTLRKKYKVTAPVLLKAIEKMPYEIMRKSNKKTIMGHVKDASAEERFYMTEMANDIFKNYTAEFDLHISKLVFSIVDLTPCKKSDFEYLDGKVLLILPEDDAFFTADMQKDLTDMMPSPVICHMTGGHIATIMKVPEYVKLIKDFLKNI